MRLTDPARKALKQFALEHTITNPAMRYGWHVTRELGDHGLIELCDYRFNPTTGIRHSVYRLTPAGEQASTGEIDA